MSGVRGVVGDNSWVTKDDSNVPSTNQATGMSMSEFYKLLAAQMQYQDPDNPMDSSQMMAQMVQTQMIDAINNMSSVNTITYAASLVGKEVTMAEVDEFGVFTKKTTKGVISGALLGSDPRLYIGDKQYSLSQLMTMGDVKIPNLDPDPDAGNTGGTGGAGGNDGDK